MATPEDVTNNPPNQSGDPTPQEDKARDAFYAAIGRYEKFVREVGIVQEGLIGVKPGFKTGYIWNVLTEDFTPEQMEQDPRFEQLNKVAASTIKEGRDHMPLRIANALPSQAQALKRRYEKNGVEISEHVIKSPSTIEPTAHDIDEVDILIGGLKSAATQLDLVSQWVQKRLARFNETPEDLYRSYNLDVSDEIEDQKAAEMIRDIAIARNASDWEGNEGFASGFELLNSPITLMTEIVHNVFDSEVVSTITELDVKDAIESGALRLDLTATQEST